MNLLLRIEIFAEDNVYVALSPELNISSYGDTIEDAKESFKEAVMAFIEECRNMGTLEEALEESGFYMFNGVWTQKKPIINEELAIVI